MEETKQPLMKRKTVWILCLAAAFALLLLLAARFLCFSGGRVILLTSDTVDLRSEPVTVQEYDALAQKLPGRTVLWQVPIGESLFDSASAEVTVTALAMEDIPLFAYLTELERVDAWQCPDHAALKQLEETYPSLEIQWGLHLGGTVWERDAGDLDLSGLDLTQEVLAEALGYLAPGTTVQLNNALSAEALISLRQSFPALSVVWEIPVSGIPCSSDASSLSFSGSTIDLAVLTAAAPQLQNVEQIDLGDTLYELEALAALQDAFPEARIHCAFELFGLSVSSETEELDLSNIPMEDTAAVELAIGLMPNLNHVDMCGCGIPSEEMDALRSRYPQIKFVWLVKIGRVYLRTDITGFIGAKYGYLPDARIRDPKKDRYQRLFDEDITEFKYCTDIVVMDLGHMGVTDYSFLEYLPNLEYLILADTPGTDFSVLEKLDKLIYLELFMTKFTQTELLLGLENLESLNLGDTDLENPELLAQMTWLEMLWLPGTYLPNETYKMLEEALPNTVVSHYAKTAYDFTGNGWRRSENYYKMRDLLGMYYLD